MTNYKARKIKIPEWEMDFSFARSSGAGGQNVNKVNTKAVLHFDIEKSKTLSDEQKKIIKKKLASRINEKGELYLDEESSRSQWRNREEVIKRLSELIRDALIPEKERKKTKVSKKAKEKRLEEKKRRSQTKERRKKVDL